MICFTSAVEISRLIRAREISAREALDEHLKQIERVNPRVNAIVTVCAEAAAREAAEADEKQARGEELGPLHGLPIAHKDLFETRGLRTTFGSTLYKDHIPTVDDPFVETFRSAGAITIGKTNTPEFGAGSQTFNPVFGATRNPYDLSKTCGGSSGGSAVALACGFAPLASGTDVGGSMRNPAAYCNVAGLRPSSNTLSTVGCMARSIADLALATSVLSGPGFLAPLDRDLRGTRIAWFKDLGGVPFDPRVVAAVNRHRATFESLGCVVEEAEPDFGPAETAFRVLRARDAATLRGPLLRAHPGALKATLKNEIEQGLALSPAEIAHAESARMELRRNLAAFLQTYDYFILPTAQLPPFNVTIEFPTEIAGVKLDSYIDWMKSCWYISAAGIPAASVPAGFTSEGLPLGLQIVGRAQADFSVLQLAHAFEVATGYGLQRPIT